MTVLDSSMLLRAQAMDSDDELAHARSRFRLPEGVLYFDGNSLGALPAAVADEVAAVVTDEWGIGLITSWFERGWYEAPLRIGDAIGRLVGAGSGQIAVGDSVSVQLFNLLVAAVRLRPDRSVLLVDADIFPTDIYIARSVGRLLDMTVVTVPMAEISNRLHDLGRSVAVVLVSPVDYRTGQLWDVDAITADCGRYESLAFWDVCHSAGAIPMQLDKAGVDFAVGCTYKYLSGGPGSPAFSYIATRHQLDVDLPLTGWHGHLDPFAMSPDFVAAQGISRARISTPQIISMRALECALKAFDGIAMEQIRKKNLMLGAYFIECVDSLGAVPNLACITPNTDKLRGSHVSLTHPRSEVLISMIGAQGVIADGRPPDVIRFGLNALYNSFADVYQAVTVLAGSIDRLESGRPNH